MEHGELQARSWRQGDGGAADKEKYLGGVRIELAFSEAGGPCRIDGGMQRPASTTGQLALGTWCEW